MATHTGKTFEDIEKDSDRDNWMTATEAKEYGLVDEVLDRKSAATKKTLIKVIIITFSMSKYKDNIKCSFCGKDKSVMHLCS
jgi:hypothetical protein